MTPTDAELREAMTVAKQIAYKFARKVRMLHRVEDYEGGALEAVAKAYLSWDASRGVPFAGWAGRRAQGAVIDEHRRWCGRGIKNHHAEPMTLNWEDEDGRMGSGWEIDLHAGPEEVVVGRDDVARALDACDRYDAENRFSRLGRRSASTRMVVIGSMVGTSQAVMGDGEVTNTRISQILRAGRDVISEVMAS